MGNTGSKGMGVQRFVETRLREGGFGMVWFDLFRPAYLYQGEISRRKKKEKAKKFGEPLGCFTAEASNFLSFFRKVEEKLKQKKM